MKNDYKQIAELVDRVKNRDGDAFVELYNKMYHNVYILALAIVKDEHLAQDVVQETFINVYKNISDLGRDTTFTAWINRISYHCSLKMAAKQKEIPINCEELKDTTSERESQDSVLDSVLSQEESKTIMDSILDLSPEYKTVVILKYYEGLKLEEIADCLECSIGTVKSRLSRGKKALRQRLNMGERLLTLFALSSITLSFTMTSYAREHTMPAAVAEQVLETGKQVLGIQSSVLFCAVGVKMLSPAVVTGAFIGLSAVALTTGGIWGSQKPELTVDGLTNLYTNTSVEVAVKVDSPVPVRSVQIVGDEGVVLGSTMEEPGRYVATVHENGRYSVRVTLQNGRSEETVFEVSNIDRELPELDSYQWDIEKNLLYCQVYDSQSGIDWFRVSMQTSDGSSKKPVFYDETTGRLEFMLSDAPFYIHLYDHSGNYAIYRIEPYKINDTAN